MHHDASLNIRQLQVFEAVARLESYSRAQQELGISVSAISNAMSQLEGQLGFTLCQRGRGGFSLTEKGQQFLQQAIRVLSELNELERQSALLKGEHSGTLCISTLDSIETETALSLPVVLRSFSDKFPHVHIKLIIRTPAEQLNGVLNNHIDLAIGSYNSQVHNIISEPLYREQHWLYCSDLHPMFFSRQLDKEQISQCPLVTRSYWKTSDLRPSGLQQRERHRRDRRRPAAADPLGEIYWLSAGALRLAVDQREPPAGAAAQRVWLSVAVLGHL
ncbi:transcriptional regulator GbuR [Klebsiella pneumoniae]|nr:transcriptional regulator GbuR [Klebsiella pneumoniae]